jgi:uncharacterized protein YecE (DUF72 family)
MGDIRLGTAGWLYDDWIGPFYPPHTPKSAFLPLYAREFPVVEIDSTFYAIPAISTVMRWAEVTPENFQFCPKLWQGITHEKKLRDCDEDVARYVESLGLLGSKLGPICIQLPPFFKPGAEARRVVGTFLAGLPAGYDWAIEFRDRKWVNDDTFTLLREHGVAWVVQDLYYMPKVPELTARFSYFRWLGRRSEISTFGTVQIDRSEDLDRWAEVLGVVASQVERVYGFFNNRYQGHSPASVRAMQRRLGLPVATHQPDLFGADAPTSHSRPVGPDEQGSESDAE